MTSTVPTAVHHEQHADTQAPITMFGPDFPFAYDDYLAHPAGLGSVPATEHGTEVAVIGGGLSGIIAAYELMKMGLKPVVYEADQIGGRLRTVGFPGCEGELTAEMGATSSVAASNFPCGCGRMSPPSWCTGAPGTSLKLLHGGEPRPAVTRLHRSAGNRITVTDASGDIRTYRAAIFTAQSRMLLSKIDCADVLFPIDHWTAIERTHYTEPSKLFIPVDRPFWLDKDERTGRDTMSMTLTDRMTRGTYLLENGPDRPAVICLSYTWCDDSLKWLPLSAGERLDVMLKSLGEIYPGVGIRQHIIGNPVTIS